MSLPTTTRRARPPSTTSLPSNLSLPRRAKSFRFPADFRSTRRAPPTLPKENPGSGWALGWAPRRGSTCVLGDATPPPAQGLLALSREMAAEKSEACSRRAEGARSLPPPPHQTCSGERERKSATDQSSSPSHRPVLALLAGGLCRHRPFLSLLDEPHV